jgi:hypothetical protein
MRKSLALWLSLMMIWIALPANAAPAATPAGAYGVVLDESGRPVSGAEIEFYQLDAGLVATLMTGADGAFRLERPATATRTALWQLRVWAKGYRTKESGWVNLAANPYQALQLERISGGLQVTVRDEMGRAPAAGMVALVGADGQLQTQTRLEKGQFMQPDLPTGDYRVLVSVPGYAAAMKSLTVAAGQFASAVVSLERNGFTVVGEVRDAVTGEPVSRAVVELQQPDGTRAGTAVADADGRFNLPGPQEEPGTYRVQVSANRYRTILTQPFTTARGQQYDLSGTGSVKLPPATAVIAGSLKDDHGITYQNTRVVLMLQGYGEVAEATTGITGDFRFEGVPAGGGFKYAMTSPNTVTWVRPTWIELEPGATNQAGLQAESARYELNGYATLYGVVSSPTGTAVPGAEVEVIRSNRLVATTETDAAGTFLVPDISGTQSGSRTSDPYTLRISKEGYVPTREFTVNGQTETDLQLPEYQRAAVRIVLRTTNATLRGQVIDGQGARVAGASVTIRPDDGGPALTATTDAAGWYSVQGNIRPGIRYYAAAEAKGYLPLAGTDVTDILLKQNALPTLTLTGTGATLSGQVIGPAGMPVGAAEVTLFGAAGELLAQTSTDDSGYYRIAANLPPHGVVTLTAARTGWSRALAEVAERPAPGAVISRDLVIFPETATLEGRALGADGTPTAGVWVDLLEEGRGVIDSARTLEGGYFEFANVRLTESGWFSLRVRTAGGVSFGGSLTHRMELVPLLRLAPGERTVTDLLVTRP